MNSPKAVGGVALFLVGLLVLVAIVAPVVLGRDVFFGLVQKTDRSPATAADLAQQAVDATQYLVTLASATFGAVGFLLSGYGGAVVVHMSRRSRAVLVVGMIAIGCSIWTGFVSLWVTLSLAGDEVVRAGLDQVLKVHVVQLLELAVGGGLVGSVVLRSILQQHLSSKERNK